jgi:hypothetical protein
MKQLFLVTTNRIFEGKSLTSIKMLYTVKGLNEYLSHCRIKKIEIRNIEKYIQVDLNLEEIES